MEQARNKFRNQKGFSLIELLIVVAIIGIISALAVPSLVAAKRAANEGSALASLRLIHTCEHGFRAATGNVDFGTLGQLRGEFPDSVLGSGTKSGYNFEVHRTTGVNPPQFYITAVPTNPQVSAKPALADGTTEDGDKADTTMTVPANRAEVDAMPPPITSYRHTSSFNY
jgi:prepilin-type N-terminal cleavage/methylation domain-containing protein